MKWAILLSAVLLGCGEPQTVSPPELERVSLSFDAGTVAPAVEELRCVDVTTGDEDAYVSGLASEKRGLHHVNVWLRPAGTVAKQGQYTCPIEDGAFLFDDSFSEPMRWELPGVVKVPAGSVLTARCHVLNATSSVLAAAIDVVATLSDAREPMLYGVMFTRPPTTAPVPPLSEVTVSFEAPREEIVLHNLFGHQHAHGTLQTVTLSGSDVYANSNWAEPTVRREALEVEAIDVLRWSCTVQNTTAAPLPWGKNSVQGSEMCGLFALGSKPWTPVGKAL